MGFGENGSHWWAQLNPQTGAWDPKVKTDDSRHRITQVQFYEPNELRPLGDSLLLGETHKQFIGYACIDGKWQHSPAVGDGWAIPNEKGVENRIEPWTQPVRAIDENFVPTPTCSNDLGF